MRSPHCGIRSPAGVRSPDDRVGRCRWWTAGSRRTIAGGRGLADAGVIDDTRGRGASTHGRDDSSGTELVAGERRPLVPPGDPPGQRSDAPEFVGRSRLATAACSDDCARPASDLRGARPCAPDLSAAVAGTGTGDRLDHGPTAGLPPCPERRREGDLHRCERDLGGARRCVARPRVRDRRHPELRHTRRDPLRPPVLQARGLRAVAVRTRPSRTGLAATSASPRSATSSGSCSADGSWRSPTS